MIGLPLPLAPASSGTSLQLQSQSKHRVAIADFWRTSHHVGKNQPRARILTLLRCPGIDSKESIPPAYVAGGPVRKPYSCSGFLAPIDCSKIPALAGDGGGCTPTPFQPITIMYKIAVHAPAERADTIPLYTLYPIFTLWLQ
jgi:hypothetical protein